MQAATDGSAHATGRSPHDRRLRTVQQFCAEHPAFTPGGMRWLLFHRHTNGLDCAVVRVGRRVLLDVDSFFSWVDTQQGQRERASR